MGTLPRRPKDSVVGSNYEKGGKRRNWALSAGGKALRGDSAGRAWERRERRRDAQGCAGESAGAPARTRAPLCAAHTRAAPRDRCGPAR
eukprot:6547147-Prymnesium_polylepis.2